MQATRHPWTCCDEVGGGPRNPAVVPVGAAAGRAIEGKVDWAALCITPVRMLVRQSHVGLRLNHAG